MLPDVDDDEVEVLDAASLFTEEDEDVPDGHLLSSGSCCAREVFLCFGRPKMLPGSTLMQTSIKYFSFCQPEFEDEIFSAKRGIFGKL